MTLTKRPGRGQGLKLDHAVEIAVEPLGSFAARILGSAMSGEGALQPGRELTDDEERMVVALAARIEVFAGNLVLLLLDDPTLRRLVRTSELAKRAADRSAAASEPFLAALKHPGWSVKEVQQHLEDNGVLVADGEYFRVAGSDRRIKVSSVPSIVSRLKKKLRNAERKIARRVTQNRSG